jgi:hypothetical protein
MSITSASLLTTAFATPSTHLFQAAQFIVWMFGRVVNQLPGKEDKIFGRNIGGDLCRLSVLGSPKPWWRSYLQMHEYNLGV